MTIYKIMMRKYLVSMAYIFNLRKKENPINWKNMQALISSMSNE
jgi:hypothetical protein